MVQLSHPYMSRQTFVGKVMSVLFNMLSRFVIAFLPGSKCLLISRLQSLSAVILEPKKIKSVTVSIVSPSICHEVMGLDAVVLVFWILYLKPAVPLCSFTFIKRLFSSSSLSAVRVVAPRHVESSQTRDGNCVSCIGRWVPIHCPQGSPCPSWRVKFQHQAGPVRRRAC